MKRKNYFVLPLNVICVLAASLLLAACLDDLPIIGDDDDGAAGSTVIYTVDGSTATTATANKADGVCILANHFTTFNEVEIEMVSGTRLLSIEVDGDPGATGTFDASMTGVDLTYFGGTASRFEKSGTITIDTYGDVGGRITGSFDVMTTNFSSNPDGTIVGTFNVLRDNNDLDYPSTQALADACYN